MSRKVFFITFEGTDGVGKSTHARQAVQWLLSHGVRVLLTREPGGGPLAEQVRALLLDPKNHMRPLTELLLYQAARVEHLDRVIRPALKQGISVVCDRFTDATLAYQGYARGLWSESMALNKLVCENLKPDLTLLFDLPARKALEKARARGASGRGDRLEQEGVRFQQKVRAGYLKLARRQPRRIKLVRVHPSIEQTQVEVKKWLHPLFFHGYSRSTHRA